MDVYEAIYRRRDIRHFRSEPLDDALLRRLLEAAHQAGSVGLMQPWNIIVVRSQAVRDEVRRLFIEANRQAAEQYVGPRRELYDSLKLEGIREAPVSVVVTCDRSRRGPVVLGRSTMPDTDLYSTCCAIQNFWLAARAEGVGVGWLSIFDPEPVKRLLDIPPHVVLVAWLCIGYPIEFADRPMLEAVGWEKRMSPDEMIFGERWQQPWTPDAAEPSTSTIDPVAEAAR